MIKQNEKGILDLSLKESNSLKGIALILLLIHHLFYIQKGQYDDVYIGNYGIINILGIICKVCVAIFVFLSGYGLGVGIAANGKLDIKKFYIRRFTKLFLNYWFIWLLFVPIGIFLFGRSLDSVYGEGTQGIICGILDFLGLLNTTGKYGYNPTWWFYSCIILLYLIFPFITCTVSRYPKSIWMFVFAGIAIVKVPLAYVGPIRYYLLPFVLGLLLSNKLTFNVFQKQYNNSTVTNTSSNIHVTDTTDMLSSGVKYTQGSRISPYLRNILSSLFGGSLSIGGIIVMTMLLVTACIIRLSIPYALLWDTLVALIIVLLFKSSQRLIKTHGSLAFLGKHSFNIFLFHTFIYYLYFPFAIYWSRNPFIIFVSLLLSSIALSVGIEWLKKAVGFYRLQNWILQMGESRRKPTRRTDSEN